MTFKTFATGLIAPFCLAVSLNAAVPALADNIAVTTQHYDNLRTGSNTLETILTPTNVNVSQFGKLFTLDLDDNVNGQVLYLPNIVIDHVRQNVIFAYTGNGNGSPSSVYAFNANDADGDTPLWRLQLPSSAEWTTATPVIDRSADTIYVLTKESSDSGPNQLHAINLLTGAERPGSPVTIAATVAGTGDGSSGGEVTFNTAQENCRPALLELNGIVYVAFAHNSDSFPYHGWVFGYKYADRAFTQTAVFCTTPNLGLGGIWQAGNGLVADSNGYIYCATGNGGFDANTGGSDYGMCYLKLSTPNLKVVDWFSPFDEAGNSNSDLDLGGAGPIGIAGTNSLFAGGTKFGSAFLMDTSNMGHFTPGGPDAVLNRVNGMSGNGVVGQNPVSWNRGTNKFVYVWPRGSDLEVFQYRGSAGKLVPNAPSATYDDTTGAQLTVSANGGGDGILWAQGYDNTIRAFKAGDVAAGEIWDSNMDASRDSINSVGHWQFITVVNGLVYVPTGNSQIAVYGLLPAQAGKPTAPGRAATRSAKTG